MVARAKDYISAGDIFQVVLSQRFEAPFALPPFALYRALRRINPSPYLYFLDFGDFAVAGSSPEILVRVKDGEVTIRPIAGTRPRGSTPEEDQALEAELLADPKERAEHLMLLDLGRNDVGRVAEIGTVKVTATFFLEYYSHVMHIVSNVVGRLARGDDFVDALAAGFPAGTVSGAPKVRAMEIIDELEVEKRGIYAGCVGYFTADGDMDTCIVLRTAIIKDGKMYVQAGAGIVADSVPQKRARRVRRQGPRPFPRGRGGGTVRVGRREGAMSSQRDRLCGYAPGAAILALALLSPHLALAQSPHEIFCTMASEAAAQANAAGPVSIDAMTTQEKIEVSCETKTILTRFARKDTAASQPEGWQESWQEKLSTIYCDDPATREVIASGWTLADSTAFADGVVFEIKAACE